MDVKQTTDTLNFYIRPQTFPLALKLCSSESELPDKVRVPMRDLGYQIALCQGIGLARRYAGHRQGGPVLHWWCPSHGLHK